MEVAPFSVQQSEKRITHPQAITRNQPPAGRFTILPSRAYASRMLGRKKPRQSPLTSGGRADMADRETSRDLGAAHNAPVTPDPPAQPTPIRSSAAICATRSTAASFVTRSRHPIRRHRRLVPTTRLRVCRRRPAPSSIKAHRRLLMPQRVPTPRIRRPAARVA